MAEKQPQNNRKSIAGPDYTIENALRFEHGRNYLSALKIYQYLRNNSMDLNLSDQAELGCVRCLMKMGKNKLALSFLEPLPDDPKRVIDCRRLAIAGELLLRLHKSRGAESALEIALAAIDGKLQEHAEWTAPAYANLGKAYMMNNKFPQAQLMYYKAHELFKQTSNDYAANECRLIVRNLEDYQKQKL